MGLSDVESFAPTQSIDVSAMTLNGESDIMLNYVKFQQVTTLSVLT